MPRDVYGVYTPPSPQNPVISGQTISASAFNDTIDDIATALTESLNVDGTASYSAPIQMVNGTEAAPGYTFIGAVNYGVFKNATTGLGLSVNGVERFRAGSAIGGFNQIDVQFVPGVTWPAVGGQVGPQVASTLGDAGTDAYLLIRRIVVPKVSSPYTLTTTPGARRIFVKALGAGGGSGGCAATTTTNMAVSGGGGGGELAEKTLTGSQIEATYTVAIGAGGLAGAAGAAGNAGSTGGDTTVTGGTSSTVWVRAKGGSGGGIGTAVSTASASDPPTTGGPGGAGGLLGTGDVLYNGMSATTGDIFRPATGYGIRYGSHGGGNAMFGASCPPNTEVVYPGQGASGKIVYETTAAGGTAGVGAGGDGLCIIEEYL